MVILKVDLQYNAKRLPLKSSEKDLDMAYHNWFPALWSKQDEGEDHPLTTLKKQIDTIFEDFDKGMPALGGSFKVRSNVSETDGEVRITAELPGVEQKDIDVSVSGKQITIKGEKKSETEEKKEEEGRQFHSVERSSGSFQRMTTLPFEIDTDSVNADFKNGVLTVTIKKPPEAVEKKKKIEIKSS